MESAVNCVRFRFAYAPYQFLKRFGIKGPTPTPFLGNYKDRIKMVKLSHVKCSVAVNWLEPCFYSVCRMPWNTTDILATSMDQFLGNSYTNYLGWDWKQSHPTTPACMTMAFLCLTCCWFRFVSNSVNICVGALSGRVIFKYYTKPWKPVFRSFTVCGFA